MGDGETKAGPNGEPTFTKPDLPSPGSADEEGGRSRTQDGPQSEAVSPDVVKARELLAGLNVSNRRTGQPGHPETRPKEPSPLTDDERANFLGYFTDTARTRGDDINGEMQLTVSAVRNRLEQNELNELSPQAQIAAALQQIEGDIKRAEKAGLPTNRLRAQSELLGQMYDPDRARATIQKWRATFNK